MQREWRDAVATVPVLFTIALYIVYLADGSALWVHGLSRPAAAGSPPGR
jgi:hypothetical protein